MLKTVQHFLDSAQTLIAYRSLNGCTLNTISMICLANSYCQFLPSITKWSDESTFEM